jgi:phage baseplate assembly protein W
MTDDPRTFSFLGTGWGFPPEFEPGIGVLMVSDEDDIRQSLHILFQTSVGERIFQPTYGLDLHSQLFEPITTTMKTLLEDQIRTSILIHEPRITVLRLTLDTREQATEGKISLELDYSIKSTNSRFNLVFPFYTTPGAQVEAKQIDG